MNSRLLAGLVFAALIALALGLGLDWRSSSDKDRSPGDATTETIERAAADFTKELGLPDPSGSAGESKPSFPSGSESGGGSASTEEEEKRTIIATLRFECAEGVTVPPTIQAWDSFLTMLDIEVSAGDKRRTWHDAFHYPDARAEYQWTIGDDGSFVPEFYITSSLDRNFRGIDSRTLSEDRYDLGVYRITKDHVSNIDSEWPYQYFHGRVMLKGGLPCANVLNLNIHGFANNGDRPGSYGSVETNEDGEFWFKGYREPEEEMEHLIAGLEFSWDGPIGGRRKKRIPAPSSFRGLYIDLGTIILDAAMVTLSVGANDITQKGVSVVRDAFGASVLFDNDTGGFFLTREPRYTSANYVVTPGKYSVGGIVQGHYLGKPVEVKVVPQQVLIAGGSHTHLNLSPESECRYVHVNVVSEGEALPYLTEFSVYSGSEHLEFKMRRDALRIFEEYVAYPEQNPPPYPESTPMPFFGVKRVRRVLHFKRGDESKGVLVWANGYLPKFVVVKATDADVTIDLGPTRLRGDLISEGLPATGLLKITFAGMDQSLEKEDFGAYLNCEYADGQTLRHYVGVPGTRGNEPPLSRRVPTGRVKIWLEGDTHWGFYEAQRISDTKELTIDEDGATVELKLKSAPLFTRARTFQTVIARSNDTEFDFELTLLYQGKPTRFSSNPRSRPSLVALPCVENLEFDASPVNTKLEPFDGDGRRGTGLPKRDTFYRQIVTFPPRVRVVVKGTRLWEEQDLSFSLNASCESGRISVRRCQRTYDLWLPRGRATISLSPEYEDASPLAREVNVSDQLTTIEFDLKAFTKDKGTLVIDVKEADGGEKDELYDWFVVKGQEMQEVWEGNTLLRAGKYRVLVIADNVVHLQYETVIREGQTTTLSLPEYYTPNRVCAKLALPPDLARPRPIYQAWVLDYSLAQSLHMSPIGLSRLGSLYVNDTSYENGIVALNELPAFSTLAMWAIANAWNRAPQILWPSKMQIGATDGGQLAAQWVRARAFNLPDNLGESHVLRIWRKQELTLPFYPKLAESDGFFIPTGPCTLEVVDLKGKALLTAALNVPPGDDAYELPADVLAAMKAKGLVE